MKKTKLFILFIIIISVTVILMSGCDGFIPETPGGEYDQENTELAYIKVFPSQITMNVNQSKTFEVKAYNSDNKLIAMDESKIKWVAKYSPCIYCVEWKISPTYGSAKTVFTPINPDKPGKYYVWANYKDEWAKAVVNVQLP